LKFEEEEGGEPEGWGGIGRNKRDKERSATREVDMM
jgi:hypothetical protein